MNKFVLFIRDHGAGDLLAFYPDEASAQHVLAAYVTEKTGRVRPSEPEAAAEEIARYFNRELTFYTIAGMPAGSH